MASVPTVVFSQGIIGYDAYADAVIESEELSLMSDPEEVLGRPDGNGVSFLAVESSITVDMGENEMGLSDIRLHMGQISLGARIQVDFLDKNEQVITTETDDLIVDLGASQQTFTYSEETGGIPVPYYYVRITSLANALVLLDAVEATSYLGESGTSDVDRDGYPDREEVDTNTDPFDPNDPGSNTGIGNGDIIPPEVTIVSPEHGSTVSGQIAILVNAIDNFGIEWVEVWIDNQRIGSRDTTPPYVTSWNTTQVPDGQYVLTARAADPVINQNLSLHQGESSWWQKLTTFLHNPRYLLAGVFVSQATGGNEAESDPIVVTVDNSSKENAEDEEDTESRFRGDSDESVNITIVNPENSSPGGPQATPQTTNENTRQSGTRTETETRIVYVDRPVGVSSDEVEQIENIERDTTASNTPALENEYISAEKQEAFNEDRTVLGYMGSCGFWCWIIIILLFFIPLLIFLVFLYRTNKSLEESVTESDAHLIEDHHEM